MNAVRRFAPGGAAALLGATLLFGCQSQAGDEAREADLAEVWPASGNVLVTQLDNSDLVAIDGDTGNVVWRFRHLGVHRREDIELPRSRLVCEPLRTPSGAYYLVFTDYLLALAPETATVKWRVRMRLPLARGMCPAVAPDSGLVMITQRGRTVMKTNPDGSTAWGYELPAGAAVVAGPAVEPTTGDVLVRTADDVFSLSPEGRLNWKHPVFPP